MDELTKLSRTYGVPAIDLRTYSIRPEILSLIPAEMARRYQMLPIARTGPILTLAMSQPDNLFASGDACFATGFHTEIIVATEEDIQIALDKFYPEEPEVEVTFLEEPDIDLKTNLAIAPAKPLREQAASLVDKAVEQVRQTPTQKREKVFYCGTTSGDVVFDQEAKRLIQQALKRFDK